MRWEADLNLREISREIIALLEKKSGYLVHLFEVPNLSTLATLKIARGDAPAHILSYRAGTKNETPDFAICWQCSFALRMYECPSNHRYFIAGKSEGDQALDEILKTPYGFMQKYDLSKDQEAAFKQQLLGGLIAHLRFVPVGLRVSQTLTIDYPELLELETLHAEKELDLAKEGLSLHVRAMMPADIYNPTHYINAAYALFWAERLEMPAIANPYHLIGFDRQGQQLLNIMDAIPSDPMHDYELINAWADYLGIRNWYTWLPYNVL